MTATMDESAQKRTMDDELSSLNTNMNMGLLHEDVGILLHADSDVSDRNVSARPAHSSPHRRCLFNRRNLLTKGALALSRPQARIELAPRHPDLTDIIVADVLATMRGRGYGSLHYFEALSPETKEEAYIAVSSWLAAELPNMAAVATASAGPDAGGGWRQGGINAGLLLGGGLLLGAPVLALGAAVVGGVYGYNQADANTAVFDCLRECGRGVLEPIVILLHAAPELRDVPPANWLPTLESKGTALAKQLLDATYHHQCTAKFTPLAAMATASVSTTGGSSGEVERGSEAFISRDSVRTVYECACALRVSHAAVSPLVWSEYLTLQLIESEWDHVQVHKHSPAQLNFQGFI